MNDNEDPILAALAEQDAKLDWTERTGLCLKRRRIVCAAYRAGAIVAALFQSMIAYVRSAGK